MAATIYGSGLSGADQEGLAASCQEVCTQEPLPPHPPAPGIRVPSERPGHITNLSPQLMLFVQRKAD